MPDIWDDLFHHIMERLENRLYQEADRVLDSMEYEIDRAISETQNKAAKSHHVGTGPLPRKQKSPVVKYDTTYYSTIGVPVNARQDEISVAYKKLALRYHPDHNKGERAERRMKEINEAWAVLKDPAKRKEYDRGIGIAV